MLEILRLLTALPLPVDGEHRSPTEPVRPAWALAGVGGALVGLTWLLFHQASLNLTGPFVAAGVVVLVDTAFTGARGARGVAGLARASIAERPSAALPGREGAGAAAVAATFGLRVILFLLIAPMPSLMVQAAVSSRIAQVLMLRGGDGAAGEEATALGLAPPGAAERLVLLASAVPLLLLPQLLVGLEVPRRLEVPLSGGALALSGALSLLLAVAAATLTMAWARARFGKVGADAWFAAGMSAEVAALFTIAARLNAGG